MELSCDDDLRTVIGTGSGLQPDYCNQEPPSLSAHCSPLRLHQTTHDPNARPYAPAGSGVLLPPSSSTEVYEDLKHSLLQRKKDLFYSALEEPLLLSSDATDPHTATRSNTATSQWHAAATLSQPGSTYYDSDGSQPIASPLSTDLAGYRFPLPQLSPIEDEDGLAQSSGPKELGMGQSTTLLYGGDTHHPHVFAEAAGARRRSVASKTMKVKTVYTHIPFQMGLLFLLAVDIGCTVALCFVDEVSDAALALRVVVLLTTFIFFVEMTLLRIITEGFHSMFLHHTLKRKRKFHNILTASVTTSALIVECIFVGGFVHSIIIPTIFRLVKDLLVLYEKLKQGAQISEIQVSQCRRRYIANGYDLDLTYITDRLIAMSWPSQSYEALYRNHMSDVVSFFDANHPNHYRVYNLCSERHYPSSHFHGRVERVAIDDHQPCNLTMIHEFCVSADAYLKEDPKNVIVVHCKGGKGRTGMMCVSYMVWCGLQDNVEEARQKFGEMRTEIGSPKVQTVESPSQNQYLRYYEKCLIKKHNRAGKLTVRFQPPILRSLFIEKVTLGPLPKQYIRCPHKFVAGLVAGTSGKVLWSSKDISTEGGDVKSPTHGSTNVRRFSKMTSQDRGAPIQFGEYTVLVSTESDCFAEVTSYRKFTPKEFLRAIKGETLPSAYYVWLQYDLSSVPPVSGDVRFHWTLDNTSWSQSIVWCWFHTSFVDPSEGVSLTRPNVDGAHKDNEHLKYCPNFIMKIDVAEAEALG